jgi:putative transcriptional regulator
MSNIDNNAGNNKNYPRFLTGHFIISETALVDPNFFRTVVLIIDHNDEGAFGLTVTRKTESTISELIPALDETEASELPVYSGGPVQQELVFTLHSGLPEDIQSEHARRTAKGIIFEPATEAILSFLETTWDGIPPEDRPDLHFFVGYAGWSSGQLENELEAGAWLVHDASADIVFHPNPEQGWKDAMSKKGPFYRIVAETGFKPSMN